MITKSEYTGTPELTAPSSVVARIVQYLIAPKIFFARLKERPRWIMAFFITVLCTIVANLILGPILNQVVVQSLQPPPSQERLDAMMHTMMISRVISLAATPVVQLVQMMANTLLIWLVLNVISVKVPFRTALSIVCYAVLPNAADHLWGAASNFLEGYWDTISRADQIHTLSLSPADLISISNPLLFALMHQVTIFSLWSMTLVVIGFATAAEVKQRPLIVRSMVATELGILVLVGLIQGSVKLWLS